MKIGIDVAQTSAERAGCAWYADALARAIVNVARPAGHEFVLYHQFGDWINGEPGHGTYLTGRDIEMPMRSMLPVPARALWREIEAGKAPLPGEPDLVISSSYHAPDVRPAKLMYVIHDLVFWTHPQFATDDTRMICQRELGRAMGNAAALLFVSESTRADFESIFPGWLQKSGRPHAIASGASRWSRVDESTIPAEDAPWLMVGSVEPRKNHACALDAFANYCRSNPSPRPLRILGSRGWRSQEIHDRIAAMQGAGLPVKYDGYVDDATLRMAYQQAFALLQPSWHEGFGLPVLEAFSQGLPVIASDTASLPEVSAGAALHCPAANPEKWTETMLTLERDSALRNRHIAAGLKRASDYDWEKTAKTVLDLANGLAVT
ncbi:MAG: glycosyltransferase family 1 protein [Synoicihabitans sp.]